MVTQAPAKTTAANTARISEVIEITPASSGQTNGSASPSKVTGEGAMDFSNRRATLTLHVGGQSIDAVVSGTAIYEHVPQLVDKIAGKQWLKVDFDALGQAAGIQGLGNLAQSQSNDPTAGLQYLRGASGTINKLGKEKVRGVDTTHYRATLDINKAAAAAPASVRATIRQISTTFGVTTVPVEAWIDGDGRARRIQETIDYSGATKTKPNLPANSLPKRVQTTLEYYDFGAAVAATVPQPEQVVDLGELLAQLSRGAGSGTGTPETVLLERRLLDVIPPGYLRQADSVGDTGPSDLEKAVRDDGEPDARSVLVADGFVAGYQRMWARASDSQIINFLYQFRAPGGAAQYLTRTINGLTKSDQGLTPFEVPGIPGSRGFRGTSGGKTIATVAFARGPFVAQVVVVGPDAQGSVPLDLAGEQYSHLS